MILVRRDSEHARKMVHARDGAGVPDVAGDSGFYANI